MKTIAEKKRVLDVLNSLEVVETSGGDCPYILVENTEENHKKLNEVGIPKEVIDKYNHEEVVCIFALAFNEGYCDWYEKGKLIAFDKSVEVQIDAGISVLLYRVDGILNIAVCEDEDNIITSRLTDDQLQEIRRVIE